MEGHLPLFGRSEVVVVDGVPAEKMQRKRAQVKKKRKKLVTEQYNYSTSQNYVING
jgi:hypothetical protein